ncbi:zinc finger protein 91 [Caerostris darwini]|uniref:Zinc finger protein 91 n=1 Tax=Caerostris darwini TaxID=1538125 RepID=A0AAV4QKP5_9ARAC|nr:zinc finger protein 91 [Caerostris darwini]
MSNLSLKCYVCKFCDLKFKNESDLNLHNQLHASTGEFSCPLCKEIFPDLLQLQSHDLRHSLEETQDVSANESSAYITFLRPASSFSCTICNGIFLSDEELFEHVSHHEKVEIAPLSDSAEPCVEIKIEVDLHPSLYDDLQSLPSAPPPVNKHSNSQQMNKNECKTCKKLFNGPISLRRHQRRFHLNKKKFTCIKCHRMFLKLSILSNHTLQHHKTAKKEFSCHCCEKKFPKSVLLLKHIYVSHALQNKIFCHACFKFFADEDDLNSHMEDHIVLKSYDCGVCKKRYKTRSKLKRHRCISNGPRPYLCLMCGKRFLRIYHLERHYAMHKRKQPVFVNNKNPVVKCDSEITPYRCEKCEKYYKTESHLQRHRCNNDGLRPFQCNVCGKRFIRIYHLQRHADLHNKTESADETEYDLNYLINENPIIDLIYPGLETGRQLENSNFHSNSGYGEEFTVREVLGLAIGVR